jgi:DNA-binding beta-propeller fold protein YncE
MREGLLVDGFNLFHAARASSCARFFPDIKRMAYLIEHYASNRGMRAVLVIDGSRFSDEWTNTPVLEVLCSRGGEPADAVMEAWMRQLASGERLRWTLVSNDVNLCRMGAGMGLRIRPSGQMADELAAFAGSKPTHSLDYHHPSKPSRCKPFNNPFGKLVMASLCAAACLLASAAAQATEFGGFSKPEAVACDPNSGELYISNAIPQRVKETEPDAPVPTGGFISKVSSSGIVLIQKFVQGGDEGSGRELRDPRGMVVLGGQLYVADGDYVRVYRIDTGAWVESILVSEESGVPAALGALTAGRRGDLYAADTASPRIFKIETRNNNNRVTLFSKIDALVGISGMVLDPASKHLFVVTRNSGQMVEINQAKHAKVIKKGLGDLDGLTMDDQSNLYLSSSIRGEIYRVAGRGRGPISLAASGMRSPSGIAFDMVRRNLLVLLKSDARLTSVALPGERKELNAINFVKRPAKS